MSGRAACAVIRDESLGVLLVSSRRYPGSWSLPGGKAEEGEDLFDAMVREVLEETSIWVTAAKRLGEWPGNIGGFVVTVFHVLIARGTPRAVEEGTLVAYGDHGLLHADKVFGGFYREHFPAGFGHLRPTRFSP